MAVKVIEILGEMKRDMANLQIDILKDYAMEYLDTGKHEMRLLFLIDSGGGSLEVYSFIKNALSLLKGVKVYTVCIGAAYSAAALIFNLGDERIMLGKATKLMFHEPSRDLTGKYSLFKAILEEFKENNDLVVSSILNRIKGMNEVEVRNKIRDDWWINADQAVELGFATKLISNPDELDEFIKSL